MNKRLIALLLMSIFAISIAGCSTPASTTTAETTAESTTAASVTTPTTQIASEAFEVPVQRIVTKYENRPTGEIIFYGASNFTYWETMEEDMLPYIVQNHGFGGSADKDLMYFADRLLYPYKPTVVFFQTGSNDIAGGLTVDEIIANKDKMYSMFRAELPDTIFVVMSGLPLPGRDQYWADIDKVNQMLKTYCESHDKMIYADATPFMLDDNGGFRPELFGIDGIHLNKEGHALWTELMLKILDEQIN